LLLVALMCDKPFNVVFDQRSTLKASG